MKKTEAKLADSRKHPDSDAFPNEDNASPSFLERLKALFEVTNNLAAITDFDDLCRCAVEMGREQLDFDRLGLWFCGDEPHVMLGSFGTDEQGQTRDERGRIVRIDDEIVLKEILEHKIVTAFRENRDLFNETNVPVGHGTWACSALWDGKKVAGYLMTDNLLQQKPITNDDCELLTLFASTVGHLCSHRRMEEALRQSQEQLQQAHKMEALGRLAGGIAHDFNNVLTTILGYGNLVLNQLPENAPLHEEVAEIVHAGQRAVELTTQLLSLGRKRREYVRPMSINAVVLETDSLLRRTLGADIEIVTLPGENLPGVAIDSGKLQQIIMNLAINARDAMPDGGKLSIETSRVTLDEDYCRTHVDAMPGEYVKLLISDTGVGIPDDLLKHIFEPFFTTKEQGKGSGLGLSMVYGIVQQAGGWIDLKSAPNKGSEFNIYFPTHEEMAAEILPSKKGGDLPCGQETVLVVEDEDSVRMFTVKILESLGYHVLQASNGSEALKIIEEQVGAIDMMLTDIVMPLMSGKELVRELRKKAIPLKTLYMSGFSEDAIAEDEPILLLQKPYTRESLARTIRQVLDEEEE